VLGGGVLSLLASPVAAAAPPVSHPPIVLIAAPGLLWSDVSVMPAMRSLVSRGAAGELSVKTSGEVTRCPAGLLAVSAGNRTEATSSTTSTCSVDSRSWQALAERNHRTRYDATIGALGSALQAAGVPTVAVGVRAIPLVANREGAATDTVSNLDQAVGTGGVIGVLDDALYDVRPSGRASARAILDGQIAAVTQSIPTGRTVIVAGTSDGATGGPQLHPFVIAGPGWRHVELRSSAAGRAPYVQLIDIAPTILTAEGVPIPHGMVGRPMQQSRTAVQPIAVYVNDNRHAVKERTLGQRTFLIVGIVAIVAMCLTGLRVPGGRRPAMILARLVAPAPVMMFIGNAVPWWRWGEWTYAIVVAGGCVVLAALTTATTRRAGSAGMLAVPAVTFIALAVDQIAGSPLQLSAPLGDNPLVAGRFAGMGNIDFAVFATAALLIGAAASMWLSRRVALSLAAAICLVAVVIDGAPRLGNDLGGVVSLIPAAVVLLALLSRVRLTVLRVAGVLLATAVVAIGIALADYSRSATAQTHVGRFVGQVLHGGAGTEVRRKFDAVVGSFGGTVGTVVIAVAVGLAVINHRRIRAAIVTSPLVRAAAVSAAVLGIVGTVLNDSGVTIAAMVTIVAFNAVYGAGLPSPQIRNERHAPTGG
jgi:hypothetical protein